MRGQGHPGCDLRVPAVSATRRIGIPVAALGVVVVFLAAIFGLVMHSGPTKTFTAIFKEAPGLYHANHVDILGIPIGQVESITPGADGVRVVMSVSANVKIPAQASAVLVAPNVVNDRYIQLQPAYTGGAQMTSGTVIPASRTAEPVSVDDILNNLDSLAKQLGPNGANSNGALSNLLGSLSSSLGGQGPNFHATIVSLSQALAAVSANPAQVTDILNHLGTLTQALADHSTTYTAFAKDLAAVSGELSSENSSIGGALSNLQQALGQLNDFVQNNKGSLGATVTNLQAFATTIASQQQALAQAFDVGPLALQNLSAAIDPNAPGGTSLKARYDPSSSSVPFLQNLCGDNFIRLLAVAGKGAQANTLDFDCGVSAALMTLNPPPNASTGPDLSLHSLIGRGL